MAGTTLTALLAQSTMRVQTTVAIEGLPYLVTDGDPSHVFSAWENSNDTAYADDIAEMTVLGGLSVQWEGEQAVTPWKPCTEPMMVRFCVVPATDGSGVLSDALGVAVGKRTGGDRTGLHASLDCDGTTVTAKRVDDFDATGLIYMGPETASYTSRDTGADTFTVDVRGRFSPFVTDSGARFSRSHEPLTESQVSQGIPPVITSEPRTWEGRWVAIWIHLANGTSSIDAPETDGSAAHLAFAGQIVEVEDADGATWFTCEDVRRKIYETRLLRDQYRAVIKEGIWLPTGTTFSIKTSRHNNTGDTQGDGNDLEVIASGASTSNEMNEGLYSLEDFGAALNEWLQGERAASRILFNLTYIPRTDIGGSTRGAIRLSDATAGVYTRRFELSSSMPPAIAFLGWDFPIVHFDSNATFRVTSPRTPRRWMGDIQGEGITFEVTEPTGTYIDQRTDLPQDLQHAVQLYTGILKIGDLGYVRAKKTAATTFVCTGQGVDEYFGASGVRQGLEALVDGEEVSLEVSQVVLLDVTFKEFILRTLLSTGTSGFNHATYDVFSEQMSACIPHQILGSGFESDVTSLEEADLLMRVRLEKSERLVDILDPELILRRCFFAWGGGRLNLKTWATPISAYASYTLDETTKAAPQGTNDKNRSALKSQDDFRNFITINFNRDASGEYHDHVTLKDAPSIREHGERSITINARNSVRRAGAFGTGLDQLLGSFSSFFGFTARPWKVMRRSIDHTRIEATVPGTVLSVTDKYIRDAATGLRYDNTTATGGISGFPAMAIGHNFTWGGVQFGQDGAPPTVVAPGGEVMLMLSPITTQAQYVPCAQVNDTATNSGYVVATKELTCYEHEHSEASEAADATRFPAGYKVLVIEMDPSNPASPLSWSDTVASQSGNVITLTTGLAGWDATKKYRVVFDAYGTATSTQKAFCYQADDADDMIANTVEPYAFGYFQGNQGLSAVTASTGQEPPSRYASAAYGDAVAYDVGFERDAERLANNLINYKTALQSPTIYSETRSYSGSGTFKLVEIMPIFLRRGVLPGQTRLLTVAPRIRSTSGATASVRVTLGRRRPGGTSLSDVDRIDPYTSATFTTTSTTAVISTAQTLDISHCKLTDSTLGGIGFLYVEVSSVAEFTGMARMKLGALS
jgi:hypothetical protein